MQQLLPRTSMNGRYGYRPGGSLSGLGDVTPGQVQAIGAGATSIAATAMSNAPLSTKIESSIASGLFTAASIPSPASPFLAIAGAAASFLAAMGVGSGCGQSCVLSSQYANQIEALLKQNLNTYLALNPRYESAQQAALGVANALLNDLKQQCSNPQLGTAGQNCISERLDASACHWKDANGACWNWIIGYLNPIANDTTVVPDPVTSAVDAAGNAVDSALSSIATSMSGISPLLLIGGGLLLFAMVGGDN